MKYAIKAAFYEEGEYGLGGTADHIFESDDSPVRTGLFDASGNPIYRVSERRPIGFALPAKEIR